MAKHLISKNELGSFKYGMSTEVKVEKDSVIINWKGQSKTFNKKDLTDKFFMDCWGGFPEVTPFQYPANPMKILNNIFRQDITVTSPKWQSLNGKTISGSTMALISYATLFQTTITEPANTGDSTIDVLVQYGKNALHKVELSQKISYTYTDISISEDCPENIVLTIKDDCSIAEFKKAIVSWARDKEICSRLPDIDESIIDYIKGFASNKNNPYCKL